MTTDAELARLQAEASAKARADELKASLPPRPAKKRPMILAADIPREVLPLEDARLLEDIRKVARTREKGHPKYATIVAVVWYIAFLIRVGRRETLAQIGEACGVCDDTVARVLAFIEPSQILGVLHVMGRVGKMFWRMANYYVVPAYVKTEGVRLGRRVAEGLASFHAECARLVGLHFRPTTGGMNTAPMRPQPGFT
jgi:hypothetical protein